MSLGRRLVSVGVCLLLVTVLAIAAVWAALVEPWPISRRRGPDTAYATAVLRYVVNGEVPAGVSEVYARAEWGFGGDSIYSVRLTLASPAIVDTLSRSLGLAAVAPEDLRRLRYLNGPSWWPAEEALRRLDRAYVSADVALWVDRDGRHLSLQKAGWVPALAQRPAADP